MPIKFVVAKLSIPEGDRPRFSKPMGLAAAVDSSVGRLREHQGRGFQLREQGGSFGHVRSLDEMKPKMRSRFKGSKVGDATIVRSLKDDYVVGVRAIHVEPPVKQTVGNDHIDQIYTALRRQFGTTWQDWGIMVCRHINWSSSDPWSQHAWANALDVGAQYASTLDKIENWIQVQKSQGKLPIGNVLWRVTGHYSHIHVEGTHYYTGTPPCA